MGARRTADKTAEQARDGRKLNEKKGSFKVTAEIRQEILKRTRAGDLQKEIARELHLSPDTVRVYEARAGLRRNPGVVLSPAQEKEILQLATDHGQPYIADKLGIAPHAVRRVLQLHDRGARGHRYHFSDVEKRAIRRDLREVRRAVAKKWEVTVPWIKELATLQRQKHRNAHEPMPFLPKAEDLLRVLRALLPNGIPFDTCRDRAAIEGLMQGVGVFVSLPPEYAAGLRSRFAEGLSMLRREQSGEWIH